MPQNPDRDRRQRMRLQNDLLLAHAAPAAGIPVPGLDEIKGTLVFRPPRSLDYLVPRFIHLDETARRKDGIHGEILVTNVAIGKFAVGKLGEVSGWYQTPLFHHSSQVHRAAFVESGVHAQWDLRGG